MIWPFGARISPRVAPHRPALRIERLEDRSVPATVSGTSITFTPNAFGGGNFAPFGSFTGSVRTASGDVNGDGVPDIITAQGPGAGSGSRVRIFDGRAARFGSQAVVIADFYAYSDVAGAGQTAGFAGGVFVAAGDLNGDGFAEVVTSPGAGASGHVKVFDFNGGAAGFLGSSPALRASFFAYPGFLGEIRTTTVNRSNGQTPLLVTASGAGTTQSDVRMYSNPFAIGQVGTGTFVQPLAQTFPFPGFTGGVSVAGGDANQLIVSRNAGLTQVSTFNLAPGAFGGFGLAPGVSFQPTRVPQADVRLGSADLNGDGRTDVLTSFPGSTTDLSPFSLAGGSAVPLTNFSGFSSLSAFQGFGMFGNTWLASSSFTGAALIGPTATATQGLVGGPVFFDAGAGGRVNSPGVQ